jgi:hypothetical protein
MSMRLSRHEMLDHLHTLAHYVKRSELPPFEHRRDGELLVFEIAVHRERYLKLLLGLQDVRDRVRRGNYLGTIRTDRPFSLERPNAELLRHLLDEHIVLGDMLHENEPMAIWTRPSATATGQPIALRRYAYVPEEFERRAEAMGIVNPSPPLTRKRDMRPPGWRR